jgi:hypothetical protein
LKCAEGTKDDIRKALVHIHAAILQLNLAKVPELTLITLRIHCSEKSNASASDKSTFLSDIRSIAVFESFIVYCLRY